MAIKIGVISQKGGVGKSSLVRALARDYAAGDWRVKIADFDLKQKTSVDWAAQRLDLKVEPVVEAQNFATVKAATAQDGDYDLIVFDGRAQADELSLEVAVVSDAVLIPTGTANDDLNPQIRLAHALVKNGVARDKIRFAITRAEDSDKAVAEAKDYITRAGYSVLDAVWPEKAAFKRAHDVGRAGTEVSHLKPRVAVKRLIEEIAAFVSTRTQGAST
jgi:chromosome partitioning protein